MRWGSLKKAVEERFAPALEGRVQVHAAVYRKPATRDGRGWITVDGAQIFCATDTPSDAARDALARRFDEAVRAEPATPIAEITRSPEYITTYADFHVVLECFLQSTVEELLDSSSPVSRGLAMLDRRLGKRRFLRLQGIETDHPLVRSLHRIRAEAEGWRNTTGAARVSP